MILPTLSWEKQFHSQGFRFIAGADEVGRGAWAGPVVAAATVLAPADQLQIFYQRIQDQQILICDSKQLKSQKRHQTATWLKAHILAWGVGESHPALINRIGLTKATQIAFRQALANAKSFLPHANIDFLLVDAFYIPYVKTLTRKHQHALIKGDSQVLSIAAASIIAKDYRDQLMHRLSRTHPLYGWGRNKGYGTRFHQLAILQNGTTRHHRHQFVSTWKSKIKT